MKRIGIIGGIGPESTLDYYKKIIHAFQKQYVDLAYPEIIIFSINLNECLEIIEEGEWSKLIDLLADRVEALHRAGADFAVIASNTPHVVFNEVEKRSPIPMLSIVEETCRKAESMTLKKPGLLGTRFTMESDFFIKTFAGRGMSIVVPDKNDREFIHNKLMSEIELGIVKDSTREGLLSVVRRLVDRESIDSLILGCTELPLILDKDQYGIPFLNTTAIHTDSIVEFCIGKRPG
ncbi:MAG TPA: amino acid racemase [Spirochaetales bacterium]|nr:amino acid racemase [Spirochaetales bacterium]